MQYFSPLGPLSASRRYGWLALLWLLGFGTASAQTITIGSTAVPVVAPATSSYLYGPIYRSTATSAFNFSRYAHLYTPAELNIPPGAVITQLAWLKSDAGTLTGNNIFNVLLANSAQTTLGTSQTWGALTTGATQVYTSGTQQVTGVAGDYFSLTLSQPFAYTGGNLLVLSDHEKQGTASAVINFVTNPAVGFAVGTANSVAFTNTTALTAASYGDRRPTLRVTYAPGGPCTSPPTAGTTRASATSVCAGSIANFSLQGASFGTGQTYQWQVSTNGTTFTDIAGATGAAYTSGPLTATRTFRAVLTCGGQTAGSTPATVTVNQATYANLPLLEDFEGTWADACATRDVPTNSWRNVPAAGNASWRRDDDGAGAAWTSPTVGVYTPASSQGARSARFHSYYAGAAAVGTLDLYINLSAAGNKVLQFDYLNTAGNDSLQVEVSTDGGTTFGAPLLRLGMSGTVAQGWQAQNVSITAVSATTIVRFRTKVTATFTSDIGLDNVRLNLLSGVPTCAANLLPAAGATNVSRGTTLTWQAGTGVTTGYDVYFGTSATPPLVSPNQPGTSYTPAAVLAAATTYYYQIVPRNANGPAVGCGVQSFTTNSVPVYCNPNSVFLSGFCGNNNVTEVTVAGSGLNATSLTCGTVTTSFGTSAYTSYPVAGSTTGTLLQGLTYPITVNNNGNSILSVWIDFNQNGTFEATEWTQIATTTTANTAVTMNVTVPANAVLGLTGLRVRSRGAGIANGAADACTTFGGGETKDFVVTIGPAPACAPPTGLTVTNVSTTSATLAFGAGNGTATNYIIQYGARGFTPSGTGSTTVNTTNLSAPITGLAANTAYQFYVTKDCGGSSTSQATGPFTFTTLCLAPVYAALPLTESFENTWVDGCGTRDMPTTSWLNTPTTGNTSWRREDDGASAAWSGTAGAYTPPGSPLSGGTSLHSARFHSSSVTNRSVGTLDLYVNMSGATSGTPTLNFDYINISGSDSLKVLVSTNGGASFSTTPLAGFNQASAWTRQTVNLPATGLTATTIIRLRAIGDFGVSDIGVDNVQVAYLSCPAVAGLAAAGITTTAASIGFTAGPTGTTYAVTITPAGGTGTTQTIPTSPLNLTGLTPATLYTVSVVSNCGGGQTSQPGALTFRTLAIAPVNDDCAGALNVPVQFGTCINPTTGDNTAATASTTAPAPVNCAAGGATGSANYQGGDIWFKVTVPASGSVTIETSGAGGPITDTGMAVYSGTCTTLNQVACDDDGSLNGLFSLINLTGRTPGEVLYIRVWEYANNSFGPIGVCVTSPSNCAIPTAPSAANLTNTTAQLTWTGPSGGLPTGNSYSLEYGLQGAAQGSGTVVNNITTNTFALTGLQPATAYCFYVRQNCGAANGSSAYTAATCFTTPLTTPLNDEPCGALDLNTTIRTASNVGATTSIQNGITLPACTSAQLPKDVWFFFTPNGPTTTLTITGTAAGMVRVFTSPSCSAGPFTSVACQPSPGNNQNVGPVALTGLTAGTRYYVAVSGFGSSDATGTFTLSGTNLALATKARAETSALLVYPNPSNTGQLTLRLAGLHGAGQASLLNALGQVVRTAPLAGTTEQPFPTRGLAAGVYTLRVAVDGNILTRKVVLE